MLVYVIMFWHVSGMNRRERLMATLNGQDVDRPAVCFYEINGFEDTGDRDPYNIYSHPSWRPLFDLARNRSDVILMRFPPFVNRPPDPLAGRVKEETVEKDGSRITTITIRAGGRTLTSRHRQDRDVNTVWQIEHLLKDAEDLKAWLDLPEPGPGGVPDVDSFLRAEEMVGDAGIVMVDTSDPLCLAASLFDMGAFTVIAMTEPGLFHRALERFQRALQYRTEAVAKALPGRLWRIYGPEYACPPYLPPRLFGEYAVAYDTPMVRAIQEHGGFARIHCHGRINDTLEAIASTGCLGLDPIEPPPQGDVQLADVRRRVGRQMTLFGNLEASDLENLEPGAWRIKVETSLREGTSGSGRGFVLMPSACPYGRVLSDRAVRNYEIMVEMAERF